MLQAETKLSVAKLLQEFLQNNSNNKQLIPALSLEGATFMPQISTYNQLMNERNKIASNSSDHAPIIREMDARLATQRQNILNSLNSYVKSIALEANDARRQDVEMNAKIASAPAQQRLGLDIQRQQTLKENLYNYLLNKREEVALQMAINEANVRLVEEPIGGSTPIAPRKSIIMALGLFVGFLIPAFVLWIISLFDVTISSKKDIEEVSDVPIAGELPLWENVDDNATILETQNNTPIVEAFRILRYNLSFINKTARVYVVTSFTAGHGKSFISRNLSLIIGLTKKRVLLIDADIRKGTQSSLFKKKEGLTSWLIDDEGNYTLESLIQKDVLGKGVDFLSSGMLPPNPAELLMTNRLEALVEEAKKIYDYIIFDATPYALVADASIVARVADQTLFVMRVGHQERALLPEFDRIYREHELNNLAVILNAVGSKPNTYGNVYGYGYAYGQHPTKPNKKVINRLFKQFKHK